jgi:hypothetical protein
VLAQLPNGQLHLGNVAEETIEGVEDNCIVRMIGPAGAINHLLQRRSAVICSRRRFDKLLNNEIIVLVAEARCDLRCDGIEASFANWRPVLTR